MSLNKHETLGNIFAYKCARVYCFNVQSCFGSILETLETLCNLTSHDLLAIGENLTVVAKVIVVLSLTMTVSLPYAYHR